MRYFTMMGPAGSLHVVCTPIYVVFGACIRAQKPTKLAHQSCVKAVSLTDLIRQFPFLINTSKAREEDCSLSVNFLSFSVPGEKFCSW